MFSMGQNAGTIYLALLLTVSQSYNQGVSWAMCSSRCSNWELLCSYLRLLAKSNLLQLLDWGLHIFANCQVLYATLHSLPCALSIGSLQHVCLLHKIIMGVLFHHLCCIKNLIKSVTFFCLCHILLIRINSLVPPCSQEKISQILGYQKVGNHCGIPLPATIIMTI